MAKMLPVTFTENGSPKTGLANVVVYIYDLSDNSLIINGAAVTEVARGGYKYNFAAHDNSVDYYCVWDSVDLSGEERYAYSDILAYYDTTAASVWEVVIENSLKAKHLLSAVLAYVANKRTGGGTVTLRYRNNADDTDRIEQTVNNLGEVSVSTVDVSDIP